MRLRRLLLIALIFAGVAVAAGAGGLTVYRHLHPPSLHAWEAAVAQPGFERRYRTRTPTHDFAVFQTQDGCLALCRRRIGQVPPGDEAEVEVTDEQGRDVSDPERPRQLLFRVWSFGLGKHRVEDGEVVPILPGFHGRVRIVLPDREAVEHGDSPLQPLLTDTHEGVEPLLDTHIYWGERR